MLRFDSYFDYLERYVQSFVEAFGGYLGRIGGVDYAIPDKIKPTEVNNSESFDRLYETLLGFSQKLTGRGGELYVDIETLHTRLREVFSVIEESYLKTATPNPTFGVIYSFFTNFQKRVTSYLMKIADAKGKGSEFNKVSEAELNAEIKKIGELQSELKSYTEVGERSCYFSSIKRTCNSKPHRQPPTTVLSVFLSKKLDGCLTAKDKGVECVVFAQVSLAEMRRNKSSKAVAQAPVPRSDDMQADVEKEEVKEEEEEEEEEEVKVIQPEKKTKKKDDYRAALVSPVRKEYRIEDFTLDETPAPDPNLLQRLRSSFFSGGSGQQQPQPEPTDGSGYIIVDTEDVFFNPEEYAEKPVFGKWQSFLRLISCGCLGSPYPQREYEQLVSNKRGLVLEDDDYGSGSVNGAPFLGDKLDVV